MKITPVIGSILVNAFAVVGFISVVFILCMKLVLGEQPKLACINDRVFDFVSSHSVNGQKYELIKYKSSLENGAHMLVLYNRDDRRAGCIPKQKELANTLISYSNISTKHKQFPERILITNNEINVAYSETPQGSNNNIPVIWSMKSKLASAE